MPPDWWNSKVTPDKAKWYIDKGMSAQQVAEKLQRSIKTIEKALSKVGQLP